VAVTSATLSQDGRHVRLELASLATRRMYAITMNNVASAGGEPAYTNVAYYTLNNTGPATAIGTLGRFTQKLRASAQEGRVPIELPFDRPYQISLYGLNGAWLAGKSGRTPGTLTTGRLQAGIYILSGAVEGRPFREKIRVR
jgi:hypothetical protein